MRKQTQSRQCYFFFFFFFQAEDGIRYLTVTGVQKCALPISQVRVAHARERRHGAGRRAIEPLALVAEQPGCQTPVMEVELTFRVFGYLLIHPQDLDRKSTRLNSSHSQISYAVFCLNKKNAVT